MSLQTIEQLKRHEGFRRHAYKCTAGKNTIGYGHNLDANPLKLTDFEIKQFFETGINANVAQYLLLRHVSEIEKTLLEHFVWFESLNEARQAVLINMAFNLGMASLLSFKNTLRMIGAGDYDCAAKNMLKSKWAIQVKGRAVELAEQMKSGVFA